MNTLRILYRFAGLVLIFGLFSKPFGAVAGIDIAQSAPKIIVAQLQAAPAALPLRNLQIEIRQQGSQAAQSRSIDAQGRIILQPGNSRGAGSVNIDQTNVNGGRNLQQQALVLNGRSVSFQLGQTVPLRIVQVFVSGGGISVIPSTVLIDRSSGFSARPIWSGGEIAEVEISTALAQGAQQTNTSTTLQIPINEWVTIAQTEEAQSSNSSGILSRSSEQGQSSLRVEMRVTVK